MTNSDAHFFGELVKMTDWAEVKQGKRLSTVFARFLILLTGGIKRVRIGLYFEEKEDMQ
jgi:hypothetical protein